MKELKISYTTPEMVINGKHFEVLRTDAQIMDDVEKIDARIAKKESYAAAVSEKEKALREYIGTLLGENALEEIAKTIEGLPEGKDMGTGATVKLCEKLIADSTRAYSEAFTIRYGDE